jgi:polar amino acid transport system substrate-binding protein
MGGVGGCWRSALVRTASLWAIGLVLAAFIVWTGCAQARSTDAAISDLSSKEISVGIKAAPPFAFKLEDGTWSGLSIELGRKWPTA